MVARGDLGLEMPLEQVPRVQKQIIRSARALGRPVIVATQVLESMRVDPRPTRAEVSDAANAVDEGADAIMLAGETAAGAYPVKAVQTLAAIIRDAESLPPSERVSPPLEPTGTRHGRALCEAALTLASAGEADAIVAVTREGKTARLLSALRPRAPIFAATASMRLAGTLALYWGVAPADHRGAGDRAARAAPARPRHPAARFGRRVRQRQRRREPARRQLRQRAADRLTRRELLQPSDVDSDGVASSRRTP